MQVLINKNEMTESRHFIKFLVIKNDQVIDSNISEKEKIFARSSMKLMQALMLIESGAADAFGLNSENIALACASHSGQKEHTQVVSSWLEKINVKPEQMACGTHRPYDENSADQIIREGKKFCQIHNNCSGNHANYLTICRHKAWDIRGYHEENHPVQQLVHKKISEYLREELKDFAIDGCSIPAPRCSFLGLGKAYASFIKKAEENSQGAEARIIKAFYSHPLLTSGSDEYCFQEMRLNKEKLVLKIGAEGVLLALVPDSKITILLKVEDGAERATAPAMSFLLKKYAGLQDSACINDIYNWSRLKVGRYQVEF